MSGRTTVGEIGESKLVAALAQEFARTGRARAAVGIGDDAAVIDVQGPICATVDSIERSVDWLDGATPRDAIGHRAAAVSLSDCAAMGATPVALLLALEVPRELAFADVMQSARGLANLARLHHTEVVGGDMGVGATERWTVTALAKQAHAPWLRSNAVPGDVVWLAGPVGMAAIGLASLRKEAEFSGFSHLRELRACQERHLRPTPMCDVVPLVASRAERWAAIDVSDGLLTDARKIAAASGARLELELPRPSWLTDTLAEALAEGGVDWRHACAAGGDDYALLLCGPADAALPLPQIGEVTRGEGVELRVAGAVQQDRRGGWHHGG